MYRKLTAFLLIVSLISACGSQENIQENFLGNYQDFCGYAYRGEATITDIGGGDLFEEAELTMILESCDDTEVRIPFHVDEDQSRTWILKMRTEGLHLSHDHRYEDGTEHENNLYGGYADNKGNVLLQYFPADERTIEDRAARSINTWAKEFDLAEQNYYYRLYLDGERRFEAVFDLTSQIDIETL
jgi:hypothetical protein